MPLATEICEGVRVCKRCSEMKRLELFGTTKKLLKNGQIKQYRQSYCKVCINRASKVSRRRRSRRGEYLKYKYNLTVGQFLEMAEAQNHTCPICMKVCARSERPKSGFHIDHDHVTGEVRGLLCGPCNRVMGYFGDSTEAVASFAQRAVAYLGRK